MGQVIGQQGYCMDSSGKMIPKMNAGKMLDDCLGTLVAGSLWPFQWRQMLLGTKCSETGRERKGERERKREGKEERERKEEGGKGRKREGKKKRSDLV